MDYANIHVGRADGVGTITLNRPASLNALDKATGAELLDAIESLRDDAAVLR